ncbi:MAG: hypothetical protein AAFW82_09330, partial [Pseudomonadota bacterium]
SPYRVSTALRKESVVDSSALIAVAKVRIPVFERRLAITKFGIIQPVIKETTHTLALWRESLSS